MGRKGSLGLLGGVEEFDEEIVAAVGGDAECGFVLVVECGGVGAVFEEEFADGHVAFDSGKHEERPAVGVGEVGVEAGFEGGAEGGFVAALDEGLGGSVGDRHRKMLPLRPGRF